MRKEKGHAEIDAFIRTIKNRAEGRWYLNQTAA